MQKVFKCPYCNKKYIDKKALYEHIGSKHPEQIPVGMPVSQVYFNNKYKKTGGRCVICGKPTKWNETVERYDRICSSECKAKYKADFSKKMIKKYGKEHLCDSDEQQKKMLAARSISGVYTWSDGKSKFTYTGSYEHDFLIFLDKFMNLNPNDIFAPAPQVFKYKDDQGKDRFYIPDFYIASINTLVEIKARNQNEHFNRTGTGALKEQMKDKLMREQTQYNFVKVLDKDYSIFLNFLIDLKNEKLKATECKKPIVTISESVSLVENALLNEEFISELEDKPVPEDLTKRVNFKARHAKPVVNSEINKMLDTAKNIYLSTDWHLWKNKDAMIRKNVNFNAILENVKRTVKPNDVLIFLGDLVDDEFNDTETLKKLIKSIKCKKIITLGNNDLYDPSFYLECGFDHAVYAFQYKNFIFSHHPLKHQQKDVINFHGHFHGGGIYRDVEYNNHADVYDKFGKCIKLQDAVAKFNRGLYKPRANTHIKNESIELSENTLTKEKYELKRFIERLNENPFIRDTMKLTESNFEINLGETSDIHNLVYRSKADINSYLKTNNVYMLKNEACNLWYMYLCLENYTVSPIRKKVVQMSPQAKSESMQLKAKIISEFTNVLGEIKERDPKYDFFKHFNENNINADLLRDTRNTIDI